MEEKSNQWEHLVWLGRHFTDNDNPYSRHEIKQRASTSRPYVLWSSVDDQPCHTRSGFFKTIDDAMMRANEIHREVYESHEATKTKVIPVKNDEWLRTFHANRKDPFVTVSHDDIMELKALNKQIRKLLKKIENK